MTCCVHCLRRSWLLGALAAHIERAVCDRRGKRTAELLGLDDEALVDAVAPTNGREILRRVRSIPEAELRARLKATETWAVCRHDDRFPDGLRQAKDAPRSLICRGAPEHFGRLLMDETVTVVGARRATSYGTGVARRLGQELGAAGLVVVSGLAFGVDSAAHRGALESGLTIAVLGCGPDVPYPRVHRALYREIVEGGLVISELPPGQTPWRWMFPARNRIMAGLASMTIVVEAAVRSGTRITADLAGGLDRDIGAVPGPVDSRLSAGPNALLADGAKLVRDAQDVLDQMLGVGVREMQRVEARVDGDSEVVLAAIDRGHTRCDAIAESLDMALPAVSGALGRLEIMGVIRSSLSGNYARVDSVR